MGAGVDAVTSRLAERSLSRVFIELYKARIAMVPRHFNATPAQLLGNGCSETLFTCPLAPVGHLILRISGESLTRCCSAGKVGA